MALEDSILISDLCISDDESDSSGSSDSWSSLEANLFPELFPDFISDGDVGPGLLEDEMRSGPPLTNHNNNNTLPVKQQHDSCLTTHDDDDMFGAPRTYPTSFCGRPARPTMISAKYRQKEERRKVLKISINKLKKIEDPESSLRRSVLINNTMRKLQRESREEKLVKQQSFRYTYSTDLFKEDENTVDPLASATTTTATSSPRSSQSDQLVDITNLPEPHKSLHSKVEDPLGCEESMPELMDTLVGSEEETPSNRCASGRKRSFDEVEDCDVQDVLSQFYLPPTPRMVTSLDDDDDEDVNVVDLDIPSDKRPRQDGHHASAADRLRDTPSYSCGQASIFNELQSVVYHSLIASLET